MAASLTFRLAVLAASVTPVLSSCAYGTHLMPRAEEGGAVPIGKFGYSGAIGPVNWVSLDPAANALCNTGTRQSPISMTAGNFQMVQAADVQVDIPDFTTGTEFENLGTTVEVIAKGGKMTTAGITYDLKQFHFHLPSEHLDNGTSQAMEMHMVWQSAANEIAVIGMYIDIDTGNAAAAPAAAAPGTPATNATSGATTVERRHPRELNGREEKEGKAKGEGKGKGKGKAAAGAGADATAPATGAQRMGVMPAAAGAPIKSNLLSTVLSEVNKIATPGTKTETPPLVMSELVNTIKAGSFQSYSGSLTTPPCSEGVRWLVSTQKLSISMANYVAARSVIGFNARFSQNNPGQPNLATLGFAATNQGAAAPPAAAPAPAAPAAPAASAAPAVPAKEAAKGEAKGEAAPAKEAGKGEAKGEAAPAKEAAKGEAKAGSENEEEDD